MSRNSRESAAKIIPALVESIIEAINTGKDPLNDKSFIRRFWEAGSSNNNFKKGFSNLRDRGIIYRTRDDYRFSAEGKKWLENKRQKHFLFKNIKWDKKWRIVIFDIPEEFRKARDILRHKLKVLGFYMLQESVFVLPYPCEEELSHICNHLGISSYVDIIVAESVGFKESEIKKFFRV